MTTYTTTKNTIQTIIDELKAVGVKVKTPLSIIQDYTCEAEFDVEIENKIPNINAAFTFDKPPKDDVVDKIESVMSAYNAYLTNIYFENDYTKLEFRVR